MIRRATALLSIFVATCCPLSAPRYSGPVSDHFDGAEFHNQARSAHPTPDAFFRWQLSRDQGQWNDVVDAKPGPPPPRRIPLGALRVTWVGHATVLVQMDGKNFLTDPIYSERTSPVSGVGPKRVRPPGIRFEDLPPIDAVLISHNHHDHLDLPTLEQLHQEHRPRIFVGLGNAALLEREGIDRVTELDWWQEEDVGHGSSVHSVPAQHFSRRGLCDRDATLWTGFVLRGSAGVVYFAGDTGFGPHFAQIRRRFGPPRLAILPIGAYLPRWFMQTMHIDPAEAVEAHRVLEARHSLAMHFDTFPLADEAQYQAPKDLDAALARASIPSERFWVLGFGEGRDVPQ